MLYREAKTDIISTATIFERDTGKYLQMLYEKETVIISTDAISDRYYILLLLFIIYRYYNV